MAALLLVVGASARAAAGQAAQPPANEDCLACHADPSATSASGRPVVVDENRYVASVHGQAGLSCVDCHADLATLAEFPHAEKLAPVSCTACHDDAGREYGGSAHAIARRSEASSVAATCSDCHGTHDIRPSADPEARTYALNLPATCGRCHGDPDIIRRGHIRIGNVLTLYQDSIHGRAVSQSGLLVAANCSHCHGSHDIRQRQDLSSRVHRKNVPATCGACHEGIRARYLQGAHGATVANGNLRGPVCSDCHTAHQIQRTDEAAWKLDVIRECGTCHERQIETYRDTFHGQVTELGFVRVATCSDCHTAHQIFPKADPRSAVSAKRRVATCQRCHPGATEGFAGYDPHADKHDRERNPQLYYAARFMDWLLIAVFTFFGVHTLFWLPRAVMDRYERATTARRGEESGREGPSDRAAAEPGAGEQEIDQDTTDDERPGTR